MTILFNVDGAIQAVVSGAGLQGDLAARPGTAAIYGDVDPATHYVDPSTFLLTPKGSMGLTIGPTTILANGLDECLVSNLPPGTVVRIGELTQTAGADGIAVITADIPGDLTIVIIPPPPYLPEERTIHVDPA